MPLRLMGLWLRGSAASGSLPEDIGLQKKIVLIPKPTAAMTPLAEAYGFAQVSRKDRHGAGSVGHDRRQTDETRAGNVRKVPPPTTVFRTPATKAPAINIIRSKLPTLAAGNARSTCGSLERKEEASPEERWTDDTNCIC